MAAENPIQERFAWLGEQCATFSEDAVARVLCWQIEEDEQRMVDAFLTKEMDDQIGELPDLFLRFTSPFEQETSYGHGLRAELIKMIEEMHEPEEGEPAPEYPFWRAPAAGYGSENIQAWIKACVSFHEHHQLPANFVAVLEPDEIKDGPAFARWLLKFAQQAPAQLRLIVRDNWPEADLSKLLTSDPKRVWAQRAGLDMPKALADLSRNAGGLDTPGGLYRQLYVMLSSALGKGDLAAAEPLAARALTITTLQGWHALAVPIHFGFGAVLASQQRPVEANARYLAAEDAALQGEQAGDAVCAKLRVQARMVRGGLLVSEKAYAKGAELFIETRPLAEAINEPHMVIDCHRLASFCREQQGDHVKAVRHGMDCTQYAQGVPFEHRKTSTLPFVGDAMKRLAKKAELRTQAMRVSREVDELMLDPEEQKSGARA